MKIKLQFKNNNSEMKYTDVLTCKDQNDRDINYIYCCQVFSAWNEVISGHNMIFNK